MTAAQVSLGALADAIAEATVEAVARMLEQAYLGHRYADTDCVANYAAVLMMAGGSFKTLRSNM